MATPVTMPMLGLTMEEGTVVEWLKKEGETVALDEPLFTVEMDKGTQEVPSPVAGVLRKIIVQPGTTVPVKAVIAEIGAPGEIETGPPAGGPGDMPAQAAPPHEVAQAQVASPAASSRATPASAAPVSASPAGAVPPAGDRTAGGPADVPPTEATPDQLAAATASAGGGGGATAAAASVGRASGGGTRMFASPRARMRARALGVDLASLRGTGPHGRIVESDVLSAGTQVADDSRVVATPLARRLAQEHGVSIADVQGTGPGGRITQDDVLRAAAAAQAAPVETTVAPSTPAGDGVQPLTRLRRLTAERMAASAQATARVTLFLEADFSEASRFRKQLIPEFARLGVAKLPWDALIARAAGLALQAHPAMLGQWVDGQGLRRPSSVDVGVAVALEPEGLVVPVLRQAASRSLRELASDLLALVDQARAGRLQAAAMQGGSFTITNLGAYRVDGFTPIVNPPETAILGVGRIADKPVVIDGKLEARTTCTLSLSFDHRVVDGATAAAFLARLAELIERPYALLGI